MISNTAFKCLAGVVVMLFAIVSCGRKPAPEAATSTDSASASTVVLYSAPGRASVTVDVTGNSMADMAYEPLSFSVKAGDTLELTLRNLNTADGMAHNWVLVQLNTGQEIAREAIHAGPDKAYVPENPNVLAASPLAMPNETVRFTLVAPPSGTYHYICTYPGHFPKMIGKLFVE